MSDWHGWVPVTRARRCRVCGKPDWCQWHEEGNADICMRVDEGCYKYMAGGGFLHHTSDWISNGATRNRFALPRRLPPRPPGCASDAQVIQPDPEIGMINAAFQLRMNDDLVGYISDDLGVSESAIRRMGPGITNEDNVSYPMYNEHREVIGIRVRANSGRKWAVTGSRNGLFIPSKMERVDPLLICEGPTDTMAMLSMGFDAIGRPSCSACVPMTEAIAQGRSVAIIADGDGPGRDGASRLAKSLSRVCESTKVIWPLGLKDAREWVQEGVTPEIISAVISSTSEWSPYSKEKVYG